MFATDCVGLTVTQMRSLQNTWQCAVSHIFNVSGDNVQFICSYTYDVTRDSMIVSKRIKFLQNISVFHCNHVVLHNVFSANVLRYVRYMLSAVRLLSVVCCLSVCCL